jgi:addiction module RelE/StbE family toxin
VLIILQSDTFKKRFEVFSDKIKQKTIQRLAVFMQNEYAEILNNHALHGKFNECRSINITGDVRIVYEKINKDTCRLLDIGTHSQLYG